MGRAAVGAETPDRAVTRRAFAVLCTVFTINLIAACAHKTGSTGLNDIKNTLTGPWNGRISLKIQSDPPQSFFASFELSGQAEAGELNLTTPLGGTVALIKWTPVFATLESAQGLKQFISLDELLDKTIGAAIPISALFGWLAGNLTQTQGWTANLSEYGAGRIEATRLLPEPQAQLRLILDR